MQSSENYARAFVVGQIGIPCLHADPRFGDLQPGESRSARGPLIFTRASPASLIRELSARAERPWEQKP